MNEAEWLAWRAPRLMLVGLSDLASDRKLRLFACACCRRFWTRLDGPARAAVELAEWFADGQASDDDRRKVARAFVNPLPSEIGRWLAGTTLNPSALFSAIRAAELSGLANGLLSDAPHRSGAVAAEQRAQADLLRCVYGNPIRPVAPGPWITPAARTVAQDAYDRRDFAALILLADLLEEAGCPEPSVLEHCRQAGTHARGCWAVDLVLGLS
jgi:hypothetical protein